MSNKVLSVSIVGVGKMAQTIHIPMILSNKKFTLDTIMDPYIEEDFLIKYANQLSCEWTKDLKEISSDMVVISTPISIHFEVASLLVEKIKYLLVEKPLTSSIADYNKLLRKQRDKNDKRIFCGHMRRFYKNINIAKKLIGWGIIGEIKSFKIFEGNLYGWDRKYFIADRNDSSKNIDEGVLFDVGSHSIDSLVYILDDMIDNIKIEDCIVNDEKLFSDIFITGVIHINSQKKPLSFQASFSNTIALANLIWVIGEKANLMIPLDDMIRPKIVKERNSQMIDLDFKWKSVSPFYTMYENIYNAVKKNENSVLDIQNFKNTIKILDSSYCQAKEGTIKWL